MASRTAFAQSMEISPVIPSRIAPTTAMAPIQMVRDVLTKPSTNLVSPPLPDLIFIHSPNSSVCFPIFRSSPKSAPNDSGENHHHRSPDSMPFSPTEKISCNVPLMPRNITQSPTAWISIFWKRSGSPLYSQSKARRRLPRRSL